MKNTMFVIVQVGVYRHSIVAVTDTLDKAKSLAREAVKSERDDWHTYEVVKVAVDELVPTVSEDNYDKETYPFDGEVVYSAREDTK